MRWRRGGSTADVIDVRGGGGGRRRGGAALPVGGGLGVMGVIVFIAIQLLGGGAAAFDIPAGFDGSTRAPSGEPIPPGQDPEKDLKDFSVYVFNSTQAAWERTFSEQGKGYDRAKLVLYRDGVDTGLRLGQLGGRPVLLPGRRARLPGPLVLSRHGAPARGERRFRLGVRDRARGRPPRPAAARDERPGRADPARGPRPRQRRVGAARAAGRLLRRRLGTHRVRGRRPRARATSTRRSAHRRRSATTASSGRRAGRSTRTRSRTARPRSATRGSTAAASAASRPTATRSRPTSL